MPDAGLGVFSEMFIPKYTWLGEYEGEIYGEHADMDKIRIYAWEVNIPELQTNHN